MRTTLLATVSALVLSAGVAAASPAITSSSVNLRAGPGTQYPVITTLPGSAPVDVSGCSGSWCAVSWNGTAGYVSANYLNMAGAPPAVAAGPGYYYDDEPYDDYVGPSFGYFGYDSGPSWRHRRGGHPGNWHGQRPGHPPVIGRPGRPGDPGFAGPPPSWRGNPGIGQGFRGPGANAPTGLRSGPGFGAPLARSGGPAMSAPAPRAAPSGGQGQGFGTPLAR
jgi:uncharacterized protein YraI